MSDYGFNYTFKDWIAEYQGFDIPTNWTAKTERDAYIASMYKELQRHLRVMYPNFWVMYKLLYNI